MIYGRGFAARHVSALLGHVFLMYDVHLKRVSFRTDEESGSSLSSSPMRTRTWRSVKRRTRSHKIFRSQLPAHILFPRVVCCQGTSLDHRAIFPHSHKHTLYEGYEAKPNPYPEFTSDTRRQCSVSTAEVSVHSVYTNPDLRRSVTVLRTSCPFSQHISRGADRTVAGQIVFNGLTNIRDSTDKNSFQERSMSSKHKENGVY